MTRRLATQFDDSAKSTGLALWGVTNAWQAAQRAALRPHGLTHVQFVILASLTWLDLDAPVTQNDLATHAGADPMMTSQVLRSLEAKDLVSRRPHPTDARARAVAVTDVGAALANRAVVSVEAVDDDFFAPLGRQRAQFTAALASLVGAR